MNISKDKRELITRRSTAVDLDFPSPWQCTCRLQSPLLIPCRRAGGGGGGHKRLYTHSCAWLKLDGQCRKLQQQWPQHNWKINDRPESLDWTPYRNFEVPTVILMCVVIQGLDARNWIWVGSRTLSTWNGTSCTSIQTTKKSIKGTSGKRADKKTYTAATTMPMKAAPYL